MIVERFGDKRRAPKATVRFIAMLDGAVNLSSVLDTNQIVMPAHRWLDWHR